MRVHGAVEAVRRRRGAATVRVAAAEGASYAPDVGFFLRCGRGCCHTPMIPGVGAMTEGADGRRSEAHEGRRDLQARIPRDFSATLEMTGTPHQSRVALTLTLSLRRGDQSPYHAPSPATWIPVSTRTTGQRAARFLPAQERRGLVRPRKGMKMGRRGLSLASVLGTPTFPERCFGSASGSAQHDNRGARFLPAQERRGAIFTRTTDGAKGCEVLPPQERRSLRSA